MTVHGHPIAGSSGGIGGGQNHPVPTSLLATVRAVPGVKDAVGDIFREGATLIGHNGKPIGGNGPPTFGANWITDSDISPYHLRSGTPPDATRRRRGRRGHRREERLRRRRFVRRSSSSVASKQHFTITRHRRIWQLGQPRRRDHRALHEVDGGAGDPGRQQVRQHPRECAERRHRRPAPRAYRRGAPELRGSADRTAGGGRLRSRAPRSTISTFIGTPLLVFAFISLFVGTSSSSTRSTSWWRSARGSSRCCARSVQRGRR